MPTVGKTAVYEAVRAPSSRRKRGKGVRLPWWPPKNHPTVSRSEKVHLKRREKLNKKANIGEICEYASEILLLLISLFCGVMVVGYFWMHEIILKKWVFISAIYLLSKPEQIGSCLSVCVSIAVIVLYLYWSMKLNKTMKRLDTFFYNDK